MTDQTQKTPQQTTRTLRILWFASIVSQLVMLGVVALIARSRQLPRAAPNVIDILFYASLAVLVGCVFLAHVSRMQSYKKHWEMNAVTPQGYMKGNLIFWCLMEVAALFGLVVVFMASSMVPYIAAPAVAMGVTVSTWPNGNPMKPAEPELLHRKM